MIEILIYYLKYIALQIFKKYTGDSAIEHSAPKTLYLSPEIIYYTLEYSIPTESDDFR